MKKTIFWVAILIFSLSPLAAQTVTLVSPNGGENWAIGSTATVFWNSSDVATVRLILHRGGTATENRIGIIAEGLTAAAGSYSWTVGSYVGGTADAGSDYYIRIKAEGVNVDDFNNSAFTLSATPQPNFTLLAPNGGETWEKGSDHTISWTAANMQVSFRLLLLKDGQVLGTIKDSLSGNGAASIPWKVGDYLGGSANVLGSGYRIRIESVGGQGLYRDDSDNPFTITAQPIILNRSLKPVVATILQQHPDLVVCMRWDGGAPMIYQDKRVKVWVKNTGLVSAPASTLKVYVEGHGDRSISVPVLAANEQFYWTQKFDWPTCGHKTVRATVDIHGVVKELNEENNVLEGRIEINCGFSPYTLEMTLCSDGTQAPQ